MNATSPRTAVQRARLCVGSNGLLRPRRATATASTATTTTDAPICPGSSLRSCCKGRTSRSREVWGGKATARQEPELQSPPCWPVCRLPTAGQGERTFIQNRAGWGRGTSNTQKRSNFKDFPFLGALQGLSRERAAVMGTVRLNSVPQELHKRERRKAGLRQRPFKSWRGGFRS